MRDQTRYILWLDRGRQSPEEVGEIGLHLTGWQGELYLDEHRRPCSLIRYADIAYFGPFRTPYLALLALKREVSRLEGDWASQRLRIA